MSCFTSPRLSDSTIVAPCEWCAKNGDLIIVFKKFVKKMVFDEFAYFYRTTKSVVSIKIKLMPLAYLIHKVM